MLVKAATGIIYVLNLGGAGGGGGGGGGGDGTGYVQSHTSYPILTHLPLDKMAAISQTIFSLMKSSGL